MNDRYLTQDIISHCDRTNVYGSMGDKVSIVTDSIGVKIVEGVNGKRFSVNEQYLSLTPLTKVAASPENKAIIEDKPVKKTATKTSNKPLTMAEKLQLEYKNK